MSLGRKGFTCEEEKRDYEFDGEGVMRIQEGEGEEGEGECELQYAEVEVIDGGAEEATEGVTLQHQ